MVPTAAAGIGKEPFLAEFSLVPHPAHPPRGIASVSVSMARHATGCRLVYTVLPAEALKLPPPSTPERRDELWRTTCFELFAGRLGESAYIEYNLASSGAWAAYSFDRHRAGMRALDVAGGPVIEAARHGAGFALAADVLLPFEHVAQLALTAVIEEVDGTRSFWALRHPEGAPDFHDRDCFVATLPAPVLS